LTAKSSQFATGATSKGAQLRRFEREAEAATLDRKLRQVVPNGLLWPQVQLLSDEVQACSPESHLAVGFDPTFAKPLAQAAAAEVMARAAPALAKLCVVVCQGLAKYFAFASGRLPLSPQ